MRVYLVLGTILNLHLYFLCCWVNFHCCKRPFIEQIMSPSGHSDGNLIFMSQLKKDFVVLQLSSKNVDAGDNLF